MRDKLAGLADETGDASGQRERSSLSNWKTRLPWFAIIAVFFWAAATIAMRRSEEAPGDAVTIRIAHWQLEGGVRDGLAEAVAEYTKRHPNVRIIQEAIPEATYGQWMSTQLMGGTAPDIVEAGMVEGHLMTAFFIRYFVPLFSIRQPTKSLQCRNRSRECPAQAHVQGWDASFIHR